MFCPTCGNPKMRRTNEPMLEYFKGHRYVVPNIDRWVCDECGEDIMPAEEANKLSKALYELYDETEQ